MVKISSSVETAQDAVSGFAGLDLGTESAQASAGSSNLGGMLQGVSAADQVLASVTEAARAAKGQAHRVASLAAKIEQRDQADAHRMGDLP